jgi:hypothetical protein
MTTIPQLPQTAVVNPTDQLMLDQSGSSAATTVSQLLQGLQPELTLVQGKLLGRVSPVPGQPESVDIGHGLTVASTALTVDTSVIAPLASPAFSGTPTAPTPAVGDSSNAIATTAFVQAKYYQPISLTGDVTGTGSNAIAATLPAITTPGQFTKVTVNAKGQVTSGTTSLSPADMSGLAAVATSGSYTDLSNRPASYALPAATTATLGGVKPGANLAVLPDGTLSVTASLLDVSQATAIASGTTLSRSLAGRAADVCNVLDYGADPTGVADFAAAFQALASGLPANGGTIYFPKGTYRFNSAVYAPDKALIELDGGVIFVGSGGPNTVADGSVLQQQQASKIFMRVGATDTNSFTLHASQVVSTTSGTTSYEKAALYAAAASYDPSTYTHGTSFDTASTTKDVVGIQSTGAIQPGNATGRAWGLTAMAVVNPASDGAATGIEVDLVNNGASQPENSRWNSKNGVIAVNFGPNQGTNAFQVVAAGGTWYDGYTVLKGAVTRYAFVLRDLSAYPSNTPAFIDANGNAQFQSLTIPGGTISGASITVATPATSDNSTTVANTAFVKAQNYITSAGAPVQSVVGQTGSVTAAQIAASVAGTGLTGSGGTLIVNYGTTSTTAAAGNDSRIAGALSAATAASTYAPLASPSFTGTPTVPTAVLNASSTQAASTAFVIGQAGTSTPAMNGTAAVGTTTQFARQDHVHPTDTSRAPTASPTFTGTITASGTIANTGSLVSTLGTVALGSLLSSSYLSPYAGSLLFGTGADGSVTISSGTTTLSRDMHYTNLVLSGTGVLNPNGHRIFVTGTLDISAAASGAILVTGGTVSNAVGSAAGSGNGAQFAARDVPLAAPALNGVAGGTGVGATGTSSAAYNFAANGGQGGVGGAGGAGTSAGGSAGSLALTASYQPSFSTPTQTFSLYYGTCNTTFAGFSGSSGGAGGGDGTNAGGGGGAAAPGGGSICLYARFIQRGTNTNAGILSAKGSSGGNGGNAAGGNAGGGGGGGAAGGGFIYIVTEALLGSTITNAVDVSGGTGGTGGTGSGTGKGGAGGAGGNGGNYQIINLGAPSFTSGTFNTSGSAGSTTSSTSGGSGGAGATVRGNL